MPLLFPLRILPQEISSGDLEEVYRRVYFATGSTACSIEPLTYPEFINACSMTGMAMFEQQKGSAAYQTVEAKVEALFSILCGLPKPSPVPLPLAIEQALTGVAPSDSYQEWWELAATFEDDSASRPTIHVTHVTKERMTDYKDWWEVGATIDGSMTNKASPGGGSDAAGEGKRGKAVSYLSSNDYPLLLMQDMILPPHPCPPTILTLLENASFLQNTGKYDEAMGAYREAQQRWQWILMDSDKTSSRRGAGWSGVDSMPISHRIYYKLCHGSVLMGAGRYKEALEAYDSEGGLISLLPEGHVDRALLHSCRAFALNALGSLRLAFEELVRAMVIRTQTPSLGPLHVDTQLACHNLGCVLDRLGKNHRALELLQGAMEAFKSSLGGDHPRAQIAQRNLNRVMHKCTQLEMHYSSPMTRGGDGKAVAPSATTTPQQMSLQERLAAFRSRTSTAAGNGNGSKSKKTAEDGKHSSSKTPADLTYLGGGIHVASPDVLAVYERMKPEIALYASGGLVKDLSPSVLLVPRSEPRSLPPLALHPHIPPSATAAGGEPREISAMGFGTLTKGHVNDPLIAPRPPGKRLPGNSSLPPPPTRKKTLPAGSSGQDRRPGPLSSAEGQLKKRGAKEEKLIDRLGQALYNR